MVGLDSKAYQQSSVMKTSPATLLTQLFCVDSKKSWGKILPGCIIIITIIITIIIIIIIINNTWLLGINNFQRELFFASWFGVNYVSNYYLTNHWWLKQQLHPEKTKNMAGSPAKSDPFGKENHLNQTFTFGVLGVHFRRMGLTCSSHHQNSHGLAKGGFESNIYI